MSKIKTVYIIEVVLCNKETLVEVYADYRKAIKKLNLLRIRADEGFKCMFDGIVINTNTIISIKPIIRDIICQR